MSLLMRPIPIEGESAAGFLHRASELNACATVFHLLKGSGVALNEHTLKACVLDRRRFHHIVSHLGLGDSCADLVPLRAGPSRREGRYHHRVSLPDLCFRRELLNTFCPACLDESEHWRQQWQLRPLSACTHHGCLLLTNCTKCGRRLRLGRPHMNRCDGCQTKLSTLTATLVDTNSQKIAEGLINLGERHQLTDIWSFWTALTLFDKSRNEPSEDHARFNLAMTFRECEETAVIAMVRAIWARKDRVHPRIQMLPFLRGGKTLANFAERVLAKATADESPGTGHPQFRSLSKKDAQLVLQLSAFQLSQAIEGKFLNWPTDGGRAQPIPVERIEVALRESSLKISQSYFSWGRFDS